MKKLTTYLIFFTLLLAYKSFAIGNEACDTYVEKYNTRNDNTYHFKSTLNVCDSSLGIKSKYNIVLYNDKDIRKSKLVFLANFSLSDYVDTEDFIVTWVKDHEAIIRYPAHVNVKYKREKVNNLSIIFAVYNTLDFYGSDEERAINILKQHLKITGFNQIQELLISPPEKMKLLSNITGFASAGDIVWYVPVTFPDGKKTYHLINTKTGKVN